MKKGFTLIELLAVIVILAILALIVSPIISGVISDAKKAAAERSMEGYVKAVEFAQVEYQGKNKGSYAKELTDLTINYSGNTVSNPVTTFEQGIVKHAEADITTFHCVYDKGSGASCSKGTTTGDGTLVSPFGNHEMSTEKLNLYKNSLNGEYTVSDECIKVFDALSDFNYSCIEEMSNYSNDDFDNIYNSFLKVFNEQNLLNIFKIDAAEYNLSDECLLEFLNYDVDDNCSENITYQQENELSEIISNDTVKYFNSLYMNLVGINIENVRNITFYNDGRDISDYRKVYNVARDKSDKIKLYIKQNVNDSSYDDWYFVSDETIKFNSDSSMMFANMKNLLSLNFNNAIDTTNVTDMSYMFELTGYNLMTTLDLSTANFDTSNVTDMSWMFNLTGYSNMETLNLGDKFNTSNVKYMSRMFDSTGYTKMTTLNLGPNFDTSKATLMFQMFCNTGHESLTQLNLGNKFDTSRVDNMQNMFDGTGNKLMMSLDLGPEFLYLPPTTSNEDGWTHEACMSMFTNTGASGCVIKVPAAIYQSESQISSPVSDKFVPEDGYEVSGEQNVYYTNGTFQIR